MSEVHEDKYSDSPPTGGKAGDPAPSATQDGKRTACRWFHLLASYVQGQLVLRVMGILNWFLLHEFRALAEHLERDEFPAALKAGRPVYTLTLAPGEGGPVLMGSSEDEPTVLGGCRATAEMLDRLEVREIHLDTRLESGQVVEALLLLLRAGSRLEEPAPAVPRPYSGWRPDRIAGLMRRPDGLQRFCAVMRFDPEARVFRVNYSYCELFLSRAARSYVERRGRFGNHRSFFRAAPWLALAATILFLSPVFVSYWNLGAGRGLAVALAFVAAATAGVSAFTVGSFLYTREHHDALLNDYLARVRRLARFPQVTPNPILELDAAGKAQYMNPGAQALAEAASGNASDAAALLPEDYPEIVAMSLRQVGMPISVANTVEGRTINLTFSAFPEENSVIVVGDDVTYLKEMETQLRELYADLNRHNEALEEAYSLVDSEMEAVADIQRSLLPKTLPAIPGLDIATYYETSQRAGGDYYDFLQFADGRWGILVADVSGHGTPAAVIMAILHSIVHEFHEKNPVHGPAELMAAANKVLANRYTVESGNFVTAFYGVYDPESAEMLFSAAGHHPPRVKEAATGRIAPMPGRGGLPLGVAPGAAFPTEQARIAPGDTLLFYTDGITEARNHDDALFSDERLDAALDQCDGTAEGVVGTVMAAVRAFEGDRPAMDDQTLLVIQRLRDS